MAHSRDNSSPFDDDESLPYTLDSTYWDPSSNAGHSSGVAYEPPENMFGPSDSAGDDAFAAGTRATAAHGAVPSANDGAAPSGGDGAFGGPSRSNVVLSFEETAAPAAEISGRIGTAPPGRPGAPSGSKPLLPQHAAPRSADGLSTSAGTAEDDSASYSLLNIKRYRRYFNVDTEEVVGRITDSVIGFWKADFFEKTTDNADLYGPFWVATTLIFVSAVTGNYASYLSYASKHSGHSASSGGGEAVWYYDINKVSYSAVLYYGYVGVIGLAVWAVLKYFKSAVSLAQVWCIYGYALAVFIPASVLCIFPITALRWCLVGGATATSALFILANLRAPIFEHAGAKAAPVYAALGAAHVGLGLGMVLYFFQY
mmetsp:Transcript_20602/g.62044  ORF Transcript_20602/g.62044 Transcript_20602/m.62044 type:complete len:370 (+) Transcript_20602:203-1312(+)|eukprot:CAMPEP_0206143860 /NCGR_PEP_ID=MMETSP1473-20131121/22079_1 /ASSEMBLY_ACC=CAM_ASM_001109 /TAXON_ID=1461547 /ORGANISM="Stichococcus sp, Strain RCC1054" /LENGTH=369 /DNA_ID=CAMNT_0053539451 /DNA_START=183 /DNA_END=1292 /DNA_ORIENTATION=-